jgi:hypothetical protein
MKVTLITLASLLASTAGSSRCDVPEVGDGQGQEVRYRIMRIVALLMSASGLICGAEAGQPYTGEVRIGAVQGRCPTWA